jgi:hypothetical protein
VFGRPKRKHADRIGVGFAYTEREGEERFVVELQSGRQLLLWDFETLDGAEDFLRQVAWHVQALKDPLLMADWRMRRDAARDRSMRLRQGG